MKLIHEVSSDCTAVGYSIYWARGGRIIAVRQCRWQGGLDGIKLTKVERMSLADAQQAAAELAAAADAAGEHLTYDRRLRRGEVQDGWRVTDPGWTVR
jgi:hypothetical protein